MLRWPQVRFFGEPKRRGSLFRFLQTTSISIKNMKQKVNNKNNRNINYMIWRGRLCPSKVRFFDAFFALFSILLGNYYGFGGIRISSLILIFGRHLSNRPLKIRGYQKSHFLIFLARFFVTNFVDFWRHYRIVHATATFGPYYWSKNGNTQLFPSRFGRPK